jgi:hypothetical protein
MNIEQRIKQLELTLIPCAAPITGFKMTTHADCDRVKTEMLAEGYRLVRENALFRLWSNPDQ